MDVGVIEAADVVFRDHLGWALVRSLQQDLKPKKSGYLTSQKENGESLSKLA